MIGPIYVHQVSKCSDFKLRKCANSRISLGSLFQALAAENSTKSDRIWS